MRLGDLVKKQIRYCALAIFGFCIVALSASSAEAAGGSWGSGFGGFGSRGGWGYGGGGLLGGRAPVRNLLGRLNSRVDNLSHGSNGVLLSGGLAGGAVNGAVNLLSAGVTGAGRLVTAPILGCRGGLLGTGLGNGGLRDRIFGGSYGGFAGVPNVSPLGGFSGGSLGGFSGGGFSSAPSPLVGLSSSPPLVGFSSTPSPLVGFSGSPLGGYYNGSSGVSYGSLGSSLAPTYSAVIPAATSYLDAPSYAPSYPIATSYDLPSYGLPSYDLPSYDYSSFSVASSCPDCVVDQSYPVGDYGFEPGYPIQEFSSPLDFGYPLDYSSPSGFHLGGIGGGLPVDGFSSGGFAGHGFPIDGFSSGGFPSGGFPSSGFPIDGFSSGGFPSGGFPVDGFSGGLPIDGLSSGGFPVEGSIVGEGFSNGSTTILDGGSIDSMLETSGAPFNSGLELSNPDSSGGSDYYDGLNPESGSGDPFGEPGLPGPANEDGTFNYRPSSDTKAVLNLVLPRNAKVLINGKLTTTKGTRRSYVSRRLKKNKDYKYQVKAIVVRDGKQTVRTKMVTMRSGVDQTVKLDFDNTVTTLALRVPVDAKVKLCGKTTQQTGALRSYKTNSLAKGKTWKSYKVSVEYVVDGKKRVVERTLDLKAGQQHELAIGIDRLALK